MYRLIDSAADGCPGHGPAHLLVESAAKVGFQWDSRQLGPYSAFSGCGFGGLEEQGVRRLVFQEGLSRRPSFGYYWHLTAPLLWPCSGERQGSA